MVSFQTIYVSVFQTLINYRNWLDHIKPHLKSNLQVLNHQTIVFGQKWQQFGCKKVPSGYELLFPFLVQSSCPRKHWLEWKKKMFNTRKYKKIQERRKTPSRWQDHVTVHASCNIWNGHLTIHLTLFNTDYLNITQNFI